MFKRFLLLMLTLPVLACGGGGDAPEAPDAAADASAPAPEASAPATPPAGGSSSLSAYGDDPCAALTEAEVAAVFGAEASAVSEAPSEYNSEQVKSCDWNLVHDGVETTVSLWARTKMDQNGPDAWARAVESYIQTGEELSTTTLSHEAASLGGIDGAALSELHGGRYVNTRIFSWNHEEEVLFRLTVSHSPADEELELPDPADGSLEQLVAAIVG